MTNSRSSGNEPTKVATSACLVPGCQFVAMEENPEENPMGAAEKVRDHINEIHDTDEIPEEYDRE